MNKQKFKLQKQQIPNILTIFRIILVPVIIVFMLVDFGPQIYSLKTETPFYSVNINLNILLASIFFIVASITDAIDGYVARRMNWVSNFGKFWDPLADKILTNSILFCLASPELNIVPIWIPIIMLIRDIVVDGTRMMSAKNNVVVAANWWGKAKTINIMIAIIVAFFIGANKNVVSDAWYWGVQNCLMYTATILTLVSGGIYCFKFFSIQAKIRKDKDLIKS